MTDQAVDSSPFYLDALSGKNPEVHADAPQRGYYKMRDGKDGPWVPVMIRLDDEGALRCRVGDNSGVDPLKVWTWCAGHPISKADAKVAFTTGKFPGDAPTIGDNSKADPRTLVEQLGDYVRSTVEWLTGRKIDTQELANQAANRRAEILRIKKLCENERDAKAEPHNIALAQIKTEYKPVLDVAEDANRQLRDVATAFAKAEEARLEKERREKWEKEEAAKKAARDALEAQHKQKLKADPIAALTEDPPSMEGLEAAPPPSAPVKISLGGQVGKVAGLRSYWEAEITDYDKALAHYAQHPDVKALVLKLAKADVKNSKGTADIPGIRGFQDRRVA